MPIANLAAANNDTVYYDEHQDQLHKPFHSRELLWNGMMDL